jgi:hypothetical protein
MVAVRLNRLAPGHHENYLMVGQLAGAEGAKPVPVWRVPTAERSQTPHRTDGSWAGWERQLHNHVVRKNMTVAVMRHSSGMS